jgi:nifR3 family TIM-barrel protein
MPIKIGNIELKSRVYVPPMAGVTDIVFRSIVREVDPNCLMSTEMVSSRALLANPVARIMDLSEDERPIGIQIFGHEPDVMANAAQLAQKQGADFVDINMGCPVPKITKGKDGCALMKEPELAKEIISTIKAAVDIPVTVKFRLGWDDTSRNAVEFATMAEESGVSAITVHGRTRQQLYSGKADWDFIGKVKKAVSVPVFGNGDVFSPEDALRLLEKTNCDGVAVARGTLGNPWLIPRITKYLELGILDDPPDDVDRLIAAVKHTLGLIKYKGLRIGANESRKHLTHYIKGIDNCAAYKARLTQIKSAHEVVEVLSELAEKIGGKSALEKFLIGVEHYDFKDSEEPGKRSDTSPNHFGAPVHLNSVLPVTKP